MSQFEFELLSAFDRYQVDLTYIDEEYQLLRPSFEQSIAGILPELIKQWSVDLHLSDLQLNQYTTLNKTLTEQYPSGYDTIILVLVDGLGLLNLDGTHGLIDQQMRDHGQVASSVFPTMTSAAMTSIMYGVQPDQHGVVGYNIYNESIDDIFNALRLRYMVNNQMQPMLDTVDLSKIVTGTSLTTKIFDQQLPITYLVPDNLKPPGLGNILNPAFDQQGYSSHTDLIKKTKEFLQRPQQQKFLCLYFPDIDTASHFNGADSSEYKYSLLHVEQTLGKIMQLPEVNNPSTIMMLTSDHGSVTSDHSISDFLGYKQWKELQQDNLILADSGRVVHAYATDGNLEQARQTLESLVDTRKALIIDAKEAAFLLGGDQHLNRFGDFAVISGGDYVFKVPDSLATKDKKTQNHGNHGSISPTELYVPALILR